jgi:SAM-dependent methyltransferase
MRSAAGAKLPEHSEGEVAERRVNPLGSAIFPRIFTWLFPGRSCPRGTRNIMVYYPRMAKSDNSLPESYVEGLIPTLNKTGWMTEALDPYSQDFARYAGSIEDEVLDIGCAYGVATLAALENGARVLACDIEPRHLEILANRTPTKHRNRLSTQPGKLPDVDFPAASFGAILAARVLHFLTGEQIETTVAKMFDWLRPGGRLYLIADTPYTGPWYVHADRYAERKKAGEPWPGFVDDYKALLPAGTDPEGHPEFINPLDPDILVRVCRDAGFAIISAEILSGSTKNAKGNEHAGVIASKT